MHRNVLTGIIETEVAANGAKKIQAVGFAAPVRRKRGIE